MERGNVSVFVRHSLAFAESRSSLSEITWGMAWNGLIVWKAIIDRVSANKPKSSPGRDLAESTTRVRMSDRLLRHPGRRTTGTLRSSVNDKSFVFAATDFHGLILSELCDDPAHI